MSALKIVVRVVAVATFLFLAAAPAQASGCCQKDCDDAYGVMLANGIPTSEATAWYRGCLNDCAEHGDPSTCPPLNAALDDDPACDIAEEAAEATAASPQSADTTASGPDDRTCSSRS